MKKLEQWVKDHKTCPAFKKFLEGCSSDEDYYNRIERPEYFLFGVSKRNPDLCKAVIKQALLDSVALQSDPDTTKHEKRHVKSLFPLRHTHGLLKEKGIKNSLISKELRTSLSNGSMKKLTDSLQAELLF